VFVIPGWRYKLVVAAMKAIPAVWMRRASIAAVRRYRRGTAASKSQRS
jgi:hypothetical protein